jgi:multidrug resistance efflux pump
LIAAAVVLVAVLLFALQVRRSNRPAVFRTTGVIEGTEVNVSAMITGRIVRKCCREGDAVQQGQVLVELESDELKAAMEQAAAGIEKAKADKRVNAAAIESARANVAGAEADIEDAVAEIEKARAGMEEKKRELQRYEALYQRQIVPKATYDVALTAHETAVADYRAATAKLTATQSKKSAARAQLRTAENQLQAAEAGLAEAAADQAVVKARLEQTVLTSPIAGTIVFDALETGEAVSPGVAILTIVDLSRLYARIDVEETRVGEISINQPVTLHTDSAPDRIFKGTVSEIGRYAEFATQTDVTRGRQDIKTFKVKIDVPDTGGYLKPGMTVVVEMPLQGAK